MESIVVAGNRWKIKRRQPQETIERFLVATGKPTPVEHLFDKRAFAPPAAPMRG